MKKNKILFVCTGNTCRSVIAQALFQKLKDELNPELNYQADSAGIAATEGASPTEEAIFCMVKYGLDITNYRAKIVDERLLNKSSLILTMTHQQQDFLKKRFPLAKNKLFLLRLFCNKNISIYNQDVKDPIGKGLSFYENTCRQLENDIKKLINRLREE